MKFINQYRCAPAAAALALLAGSASAQFIGPSTSSSPYVLPVGPGISTTSILTVGENAGGYRLVGIPDGMGAMGNGDGTFTLLVNHELGATVGDIRAHGSRGAFVSRWNINASAGSLVVNSGRDHNTSASDVFTWNGSGYVAGTTAFGRLCSADLAAPSAYLFTDDAGGTFGTANRIFMNGEESGAEGRAFAHIVTGSAVNQSYQLPRLGRFSWENSVASPFAQRQTVVFGTDDSTPGQTYLYVGEKQAAGNDIERAGLTNGNLYGIRVSGVAAEPRAPGITQNARFDLFNHGDVSNTTGAALQTASVANGVTEFLRPEDAAWDPRPGRQNDLYFVTTDRFNNEATGGAVGRSRLYRMRFDDITNPQAGGTLTTLLTGTEGQQMFDNLTIDSHGRILIQEDPGANDYLAKIWLYDIDSAGFGVVARHNPAFFSPGAAGFLTRDEESSGIIDARDILGDGWFLLNSQAHYGIPGELVEGGQILAMFVDPSIVPGPGAAGLFGLAGLAAVRRRRR